MDMANAYTNNALQRTFSPIFRTGGTVLIIIQSQMRMLRQRSRLVFSIIMT